tara:strand:+ start:2577 stop:4517 length:1941 start_codon:yes stop_codon:yes gene_type:complete
MGGGLIQISAYGKENIYLNDNPKITFFKSVYRTYSNFSIQSIDINFEGEDKLKFSEEIKLKTKLFKNGDLVNKVFLKLKTPNIFSNNDNGQKFKWVNNLGISLIKNIKIIVGGELIEEFDGEYIDLYYNTVLNKKKKVLYNNLSMELPNQNYNQYDFNESYTENSSVYLSKFFKNQPSFSKSEIIIPIPFWFSINNGCSLPIGNLQYHDAVVELTLRPIIELFTVVEYQNITLKESLKKRVEPTTEAILTPILSADRIIGINIENPGEGYIETPRIHFTDTNGSGAKANVVISNGIISQIDIIENGSNYTNPSVIISPYVQLNPETQIVHEKRVISNDENSINTFFENGEWIIEPILQLDYIFLDEDEKKKFVSHDLKYIVNPIRKFNLSELEGNINYKHETTNCIEEIIIVPKRNDTHLRNQWLNFSNFDDNFKSEEYCKYQKYFYICQKEYEKQLELGNSPTSYFEYLGRLITNSSNTEIVLDSLQWDYLDQDLFVKGIDAYQLNDIKELLSIWEYRNYYDIPVINNINYTFYTESIIDKCELFIDTRIRQRKRDYKFFSELQGYLFHNQKSKKGILKYSFSLNPDLYQPSGTINMTNIKNIEFDLEFKTQLDNISYKYNVDFYIKYVNIINISSGMSNLLFRN